VRFNDSPLTGAPLLADSDYQKRLPSNSLPVCLLMIGLVVGSLSDEAFFPSRKRTQGKNRRLLCFSTGYRRPLSVQKTNCRSSSTCRPAQDSTPDSIRHASCKESMRSIPAHTQISVIKERIKEAVGRSPLMTNWVAKASWSGDLPGEAPWRLSRKEMTKVVFENLKE
jgi:hypothetical protein